MGKGIILKGINTPFGETVIKLTDQIKYDPFWTASEQEMLSLVGAYVETEKVLTYFQEILIETYAILKEHNQWHTLSEKLLSSNDAEFRELITGLALFHTDEGWEMEEERSRTVIIAGALKRLESLITIVERFKDKYPLS